MFIIKKITSHCITQPVSKNVNSYRKFTLTMSQPIEIKVETAQLLNMVKTIVPDLTNDKHKGQYGRIGVIGGSLEYTGAPYFAAISALKVGADLVHVFCQNDAANVIKSYSPELIVHPVLNDENSVEKLSPLLERLHVAIIGPGLGRDPKIQKAAIDLIQLCLDKHKPLIIDADGLALLTDRFDLICGRNNIILTPNAIEFKRLFGDRRVETSERMLQLGEGVIILEKSENDRIHVPHTNEIYVLPSGGSGRRCGGQGDLLCGSLGTFFNWALQSNQANPSALASYAACHLVKSCNAEAFKKIGRGFLASDMIHEIPFVFKSIFETNEEIKS